MDRSSLCQSLGRLTTGEVLFDDLSREIYSTAACLYRIRPLGIVAPRAAEEVSRIVAFLAQAGIPITARGAGTGVAGQSVNSGVILDFAHFMKRVRDFDPETATVEVEPGAILAQLNHELLRLRRFFPPDPSSGDYCTLGGMIANNAGGPHSIRFGSTRDWVESLEVVLADGTRTELRPVRPEEVSPQSRLEALIYREIPALLRHNHELIERYRPRVKNSSGYLLWDLVDPEGRLNLAPLVVGSEGTLAIVTKARLRTQALPEQRATALLFFDELHKAGAAVAVIRPLKPWAIEIMDRQFIRLVREHDSALRASLPEKAQAMLLVEFAGDGGMSPAQALRELNRVAVIEQRLAFAFREAVDPLEQEKLWAVRKAASPILYRRMGRRRLTRFIEDIVIPPERLAEGIAAIQKILSDHGTEAPILGHAGDGNLHINPELDLLDPNDRARMQDLADAIYDLAIRLGGSITGEHGDGILRAPYVKRQFGPLVEVFKEVKRIFDPAGVLNPGKILRDEERLPLSNLRLGSHPQPADYPPVRRLQEPSLKSILLDCHGCGLCRTYCPVFLATGREADLPRSKLGALRGLAQGDLSGQEHLPAGALDALLAACISCERCLSQCPTGVDTSRVMMAAKQARLFSQPLSLRDRLLGNLDQIGRGASLAPALCNRLLQSRRGRQAGERILAVRRDAALPPFTRDRLQDETPAPGPISGLAPLGRVLYYAGCLERRHDPGDELGLALQVLQRVCREVVIPDLPCCGLPQLMAGDQAHALDHARTLVQAIRPWLGGGPAVVSSCPGCALMLRHHYPILLGEEGEALAQATGDVFDYVESAPATRRCEGRAASGRVRVLAWHRPCHQAALSGEGKMEKVLQALPGLTWAGTFNQCCGLAGSFGLKSEHRAVSAAIGRSLAQALRETDAEAVVSACPGCRLQIAGLGFQVLSPLRLLIEQWSALPE
jgi:FAD/FMN-containing dehydrogenase/Fe-S oxidoreductase